MSLIKLNNCSKDCIDNRIKRISVPNNGGSHKRLHLFDVRHKPNKNSYWDIHYHANYDLHFVFFDGLSDYLSDVKAFIFWQDLSIETKVWDFLDYLPRLNLGIIVGNLGFVSQQADTNWFATWHCRGEMSLNGSATGGTSHACDLKRRSLDLLFMDLFTVQIRHWGSWGVSLV